MIYLKESEEDRKKFEKRKAEDEEAEKLKKIEKHFTVGNREYFYNDAIGWQVIIGKE